MPLTVAQPGRLLRVVRNAARTVLLAHLGLLLLVGDPGVVTFLGISLVSKSTSGGDPRSEEEQHGNHKEAASVKEATLCRRRKAPVPVLHQGCVCSLRDLHVPMPSAIVTTCAPSGSEHAQRNSIGMPLRC
jgi:hypothetical protein